MDQAKKHCMVHYFSAVCVLPRGKGCCDVSRSLSLLGALALHDVFRLEHLHNIG